MTLKNTLNIQNVSKIIFLAAFVFLVLPVSFTYAQWENWDSIGTVYDEYPQSGYVNEGCCGTVYDDWDSIGTVYDDWDSIGTVYDDWDSIGTVYDDWDSIGTVYDEYPQSGYVNEGCCGTVYGDWNPAPTYGYEYTPPIVDSSSWDWNLDLELDFWDYEGPSYRHDRYYPTYYPTTYTPSSSYYNNVVNTNTNITNTNINNTNTNINNNSGGYPVYIPQAQPQPVVNYTYPRTIVTQAQPQPYVTVATARTGYIGINQVPYTGTNDFLYVIALIVAVFGVGAVLFLYKSGAFDEFELPAFATANTAHAFSEEDETTTENNTLSLQTGEDGPKLSFNTRK